MATRSESKVHWVYSQLQGPVAYPGFQHGRGRGAVGAEGVGCTEGVPLPTGGGIWGVFWVKILYFNAFLPQHIFLPCQWRVLTP